MCDTREQPPRCDQAHTAETRSPSWGGGEGEGFARVVPARYGGPGRDAPAGDAFRLSKRSGRLAQDTGEFGLDVHVIGFLAGRDDLVGAAEKVGDLLDRRLVVRLAER